MRSNPVQHKVFVHADGALAEFMCHVHVIGLTMARARELIDIHRTHLPDECTVHLESAYLLTTEDGL
ncbi:hypothetical protein [Nocardia macrotermitis]|uniref:Uncharacterized protein n=1 Tax=Nocardia macrotermitis TaxID=2585198 RepID=A0A7K0CXC2_9NOCA|nr:hypothetical protein [Nocardia macrotermitis]MQY18073.1 hypothetical protein [Nocardia macrotermitis]